MPEIKETLLNRLGIAEAMAHRAKATASRLQKAAAKHHDAANADIAALGQQIETAGVGADEDAEDRYCRALVARGHMAQAHHLAGMDAARMPEIGASLDKGQESFSFDEENHPRAPKGSPSGGEFVPKEKAAPGPAGFEAWSRKGPDLPVEEVEDLGSTGYYGDGKIKMDRRQSEILKRHKRYGANAFDAVVMHEKMHHVWHMAFGELREGGNPEWRAAIERLETFPMSEGVDLSRSQRDSLIERAVETLTVDSLAPERLSDDERTWCREIKLNAYRSAHINKAVRRPFIPPDMPTWTGDPQDPYPYLPLNFVEDRGKCRAMAEQMAAGHWTWNVPLIRCGSQLLTGSHRFIAAKATRTPLKVMDVDDLFNEAGLDFRETWEQHAQPYDGWPSNLDYALKQLPPELLAKYGVDLG